MLKYIPGFITLIWSFHWFNKWVQSIPRIHQSNFTNSQWKTYSCCHQWIVTANQWPFTDSDLESKNYLSLVTKSSNILLYIFNTIILQFLCELISQHFAPKSIPWSFLYFFIAHVIIIIHYLNFNEIITKTSLNKEISEKVYEKLFLVENNIFLVPSKSPVFINWKSCFCSVRSYFKSWRRTLFISRCGNIVQYTWTFRIDSQERHKFWL